MELVVVNERSIQYVATFHGLNGYGNSIQTYPSKNGFADANAIELATGYAKTVAPFFPEGTVNVVVRKEETETLDSIFFHNHAFTNFLNELKHNVSRSPISTENEGLIMELDCTPDSDVQKFNYAVADMFDELVYRVTGNHLEDYVAKRRAKEIANFTIVVRPKEGDSL